MALRWTLGILALLVGAGWIALAIFGNSFRGSFGASSVDLLTRIGPPLVMGLVLASVGMPGNRLLLHATGIAVAAACIGLVMVMRESVFVGTVGLAFGAAWFAYYFRTI